jgi:hypothetical protein
VYTLIHGREAPFLFDASIWEAAKVIQVEHTGGAFLETGSLFCEVPVLARSLTISRVLPLWEMFNEKIARGSSYFSPVWCSASRLGKRDLDRLGIAGSRTELPQAAGNTSAKVSTG